MLTKDMALNADDLLEEVVKVPEWDTEAIVKTLSGAERDHFELLIAEQREDGGHPNIRATVVAMSVVDDKGQRVFTDSDIPALGKKSGAALDRIFSVARRISRLTDEDIEELEGN